MRTRYYTSKAAQRCILSAAFLEEMLQEVEELMLHPNIENFIGCDSSYRQQKLFLYGAPFDSPQAIAPVRASVLRPFVMKALVWKLTALIRTRLT